MQRIKDDSLRLEILGHINDIRENYPTTNKNVMFKYPSMPILEHFGNKTVEFELFGTEQGISRQIDSITVNVGLIYCFTGYVEETDAYVIRAFPTEILNVA